MNFLMIGHVDTLGFLSQVIRLKPHEFTGIKERGEGGHWPERSKMLRGPAQVSAASWQDDLPCRDLPDLEKANSFRSLTDRVRRAVSEQQARVGRSVVDTSAPLGRILLSVLPPYSVTPWRRCEGDYHDRHLRFHIPLVTNPAAVAFCGAEMVHMPVGSVWWFNGGQKHDGKNPQPTHSLANWGRDRRIHLTVDFRVPGEDVP